MGYLMSNLFSSFDPMVSIIGYRIRLNWLSGIIPLLYLPQIYWLTGSQILKTVQNIIRYLYGELSAVFGLVTLPGTVFIFLRFFFFYFLLQFNRIGSIYFYKVKTHIFYLNIGYTNLIGKNSILYKKSVQ